MNKQNLYAAVARGLVDMGLSPEDAGKMVQMTTTRQQEEWSRILVRCGNGEISRVYIVSALVEETPCVFVYAPGPEDNIRHVMDFVSQGPIGADVPTFRHYPVSSFDVSAAVRKAVVIEKARALALDEANIA